MPLFDRDEVIAAYVSGIDAIQDSFSKQVTLYFPPTQQNVNNDNRDAMRPGQSKLPDFKDDAIVLVENTRVISARIQWNPKNLERYGLKVEDSRNTVRIIAYIDEAKYLKSCDFIVPNGDRSEFLSNKCHRLTDPIPLGLGEDRYCVCFFIRTS